MDLGIETRLSDQITRYLDLATDEAKLTAGQHGEHRHSGLQGRWHGL
jgi:hypothetical protein